MTFAGFIYLMVLTAAGVGLSAVNALVVVAASLLPDIDTAVSTAGRALPFLSIRIERAFGHRTITHSVACVAAIALAALPLRHASGDLYWCLLAGYASHPFLDTMTVNGVQLFYPFSDLKCVFPLEVNNPGRYRVQTGGKMDRTLAFLFLAASVPAFVVAYKGHERFIRETQQSIEAAVREYNDISRDYRVLADMSVRDMVTKEPFAGTVEVLGALDAHTLVIIGPDRLLHTVGKEFQADKVAEKIVCRKGEPAAWSIGSIDMAGRFLSSIAEEVDTSAENTFFGSLVADGPVSLPEHTGAFAPVTGSGSTVTFNYARYEDIRNLGIGEAFIERGSLTVRSLGPPSRSAPGGRMSRKLIRLAVTLGADETVILVRQAGDTVLLDEIVALRSGAGAIVREIEMSSASLRSLNSRSSAAAEELERKIALAREACAVDSAACTAAASLAQAGYTADGPAREAALRWARGKERLAALETEKEIGEQKAAEAARKLAFTLERLEARRRLEDGHTAVHSPCPGVLVDVRRSKRRGKEEVAFIFSHAP